MQRLNHAGIGESRKATDDFIKTEKKVQTQMRWLLIWTLFSTNCKVTGWQMKELKPYLRRSLTTSCPLKFFMNRRAGNPNKSTSQQRFPIFSPELSKIKRSVELLSRETRRNDFKTASSLAVGRFVLTLLRSVRTVTTSGQYSPIRPSRSVSKRLIFYMTLGTSAHENARR